ncbi:MAG TPA: hypothetical protein VFH94_11755 [Streptomyces sp.]|nr:hypothetical protein [Streptomyces sp.]
MDLDDPVGHRVVGKDIPILLPEGVGVAGGPGIAEGRKMLRGPVVPSVLDATWRQVREAAGAAAQLETGVAQEPTGSPQDSRTRSRVS